MVSRNALLCTLYINKHIHTLLTVATEYSAQTDATGPVT